MYTPELDEAKCRELIIYIAGECSDDQYFGATKLHKILFLADFGAYKDTGCSITGSDYLCMPYGPLADGINNLVSSMSKGREQSLLVRDVIRAGYRQRYIVPVRAPDISRFTEQELRLVNKAIKRVRNKTAKQVSNLTHHFVGWQLADDGAVIPYETVFLSRQKANRFDKKRAEELMALGHLG